MARPLGLLMTVLLSAACDPGSAAGAPCGSDGACATGLACGFGRCRQLCAGDAACAPGRCVLSPEGRSVCTLEAEWECARPSDCPGELACHGGECRSPCALAEGDECPAGARCVVEEPALAPVCAYGPRGPDAGVASADASSPEDGGAGPSVPPGGWRLPAACIPAPGEPIGQSCAGPAGCPEACDVEREVTVEVAGADEPLTFTHSPGGTCVDALAPDASCDGVSCGPCARCVEYASVSACRDRCDPFAPSDASGCRPGYVCDVVRAVCLPRCVSDLECRAREQDGELRLDGRSVLVCHDGRCVNPTPEGGSVGDPCERDADCGADLYCLMRREGELRAPLPCAGAACDRFTGGYCTRRCRPGAGGCPDGARCASAASITPAPICVRGCEVGADAEEDILSARGHGAGCRPGYACWPLDPGPIGGCLPGRYTGVTEQNVGLECVAGSVACRSPYGLGECDPAHAYCTVYGCDHEALPDDLCGERAVCHAGRCRRRCETAADCVDAGTEPRYCVEAGEHRVCSAFCGVDADCPSGYACDLGRCELPGVGGCSVALDLARIDETPGPELRATLPLVAEHSELDPSPCGWTAAEVEAGTGVSYHAREPSAVTIEVTSPAAPVAVAVLRSEDSCASTSALGCESAAAVETLQLTPVRLDAGDSVHVMVFTDAPEAIGAEVEVLTRVSPVAGLAAPCELDGSIVCDADLDCQPSASDGRSLCLPPATCGGLPVLDLQAESEAAADLGWTVRYDHPSGLEAFAATCQPGAAQPASDVVLRYEPAEHERLRLWSDAARLSLWSGGCPDTGAALGCRSGVSAAPPLLRDVPPSEPLHVLLEGTELSWASVALREIGAVCEPAAAPCAGGSGCQRQADGVYRCGQEDLGCGPGVGVIELGSLGARDLTLPIASEWLPSDGPCVRSRPTGQVLRFTAAEDLELALSSVGSAPLTFAVRTDCSRVSDSLACASAVAMGQTGRVDPGQTVWVIAAPVGAGGPGGAVRLVTEPVQRAGEPCELERCETGVSCNEVSGSVSRFCGEFCGDGRVQGAEHCDDGNRAHGDGCSADCRVEIPNLGTDACELTAPPVPFVEETPGGDLVTLLVIDPPESRLDDEWCLGGAADRFYRIDFAAPVEVEVRTVREGMGSGLVLYGADCSPYTELPMACAPLPPGGDGYMPMTFEPLPAGTYHLGMDAFADPVEILVRLRRQ